MTLTAESRSASGQGRLIGGAMLGAILIAVGLVLAGLTIATPWVSTLVPGASPGGGGLSVGFGVRSSALIAGGALVVAGMSRIVTLAAVLRQGGGAGGAAARALAGMADEVVVAGQVSPDGGPLIPELALGGFGIAVIHQLPRSRSPRLGPSDREWRPFDGQPPTASPLEGPTRDADRVRRWLSGADLDFVVRVYAALVVGDGSISRSASCAVITAEQIPAWIASLPPQRTLTRGRRDRLVGMARGAHRAEAGDSGRSW